MGLSPRISSSSLSDDGSWKGQKAIKNGNPDPSNWRLVKHFEFGRFLVVHLNYPDCTNYEGNKILVFSDLTLTELVNQKLVDPHFFPNGKYRSPVARFEPTERGWKMAQHFVKALRL